MAQIDIIIDGYNLMHAAGLARKSYAAGDLERCRRHLLNLVRHGLTADQRARTMIIFDGQAAEENRDLEFHFHGMLVGFSRPHEEADDVIEQFILSHSSPKQLQVISSDHRLQKAARARRAQSRDSEEFVEQLEKSLRGQKRDGENPAEYVPEKPVDESADDWLAEFGEIDLKEIENSLQRDVKRAEAIRKQSVISPQPPTSKPNKTVSHQAEEEPETLPESSPLDLDFWEKRIAELDREGY